MHWSRRYDAISYYYIILSYSFAPIGTKSQYYPLSPPQKLNKDGKDINDDHPNFDPYALPIQTIEDYWNVIGRLESAKGNKKQYADIVQETGVSSLSTCSASPAFSHPFFSPLDPFHLFYENCMPHLWDIWVSYSSESEIVHMPKNIASALGEVAESATATLPLSFSGPIQDPSKKQESSYKIYEWMALLHWYIVPIAWELGFNREVVKNFAIFSNVVEYAMTAIPPTQKDLITLYAKIVDFLQGFEHIYVGNIFKIPHCRLCLFQLIFVPFHIPYHGSKVSKP